MRLTGVRASVQITTGSGAIAASGFCGHSLRAVSDSGSVTAAGRLLGRSRWCCARAAATCAPSSPPGATAWTRRATPAAGACAASWPSDDASFQVQALSTSGDVAVDGAS